MSCESKVNKVARVAAPLCAGISGLAGKRAFTIGLTAAGSSLAACLALLAFRRRHKKWRAGFLEPAYIKPGFDLAAGQRLTDEFEGAQLSLDSLKEAAGPGSACRPVLKQGGEDDIFVAEGPEGDIYYSLPEEAAAKVQAIVPREGRSGPLKQRLHDASQKNLLTGKATGYGRTNRGDRNCTRNSNINPLPKGISI